MFFGSLFGSVLGQLCEKMEYGKRVKTRVKKESTGNEVGGRGGGQRRGGRLRLAAMQGSLHYYLTRPATSEGGAADDGKHASSMIEVDTSLLEA